MRPPMLAAFDEEERRSVLLADHAAIHPDIHHAGIGVFGDDGGESMDITAAFEIVPFRNRKLGLVDGVAADDDFFPRSGADRDWRNRLTVFLHHVLNEFAIGGVARKAERARKPRARAQSADAELCAAAAG